MRLSQHRSWHGYCVYSGKFLPDAALNDEHIIPKSLGGYRSTVIRTSRTLNSLFATSIDARIAADPSISLARLRANTRGHSRTPVRPRIKNARAWQDGQGILDGEQRYTIEFQQSGTAKIWDQKTGRFLPPTVLSDTGFVVDNWEIDHVARAKFVVKTMLGVGWKYLGPSFLQAIDAPLLRRFLTENVAISTDGENATLHYSDEYLVRHDSDENRWLQKIKNVLLQDKISTILVRESNGFLEWSVSCVGEMVGVVLVPLSASFFRGDVQKQGGIRFDITRNRLTPILIAPFQ
jgi:hypothetical protein